jgi:sugar phosphate isomerase/epimerase
MTQNEIIEMAKKAGARQMVSSLTHPNGPVTELKFDLDSESIKAFAKLVAEKEREACVELCLQHSMIQLDERVMRGIDHCIEAIKARGQE